MMGPLCHIQLQQIAVHSYEALFWWFQFILIQLFCRATAASLGCSCVAFAVVRCRAVCHVRVLCRNGSRYSDIAM